jgi:hypothetical protein
MKSRSACNLVIIFIKLNICEGSYAEKLLAAHESLIHVMNTSKKDVKRIAPAFLICHQFELHVDGN